MTTEISDLARQVATMTRAVAPRIAEHAVRTPLVEFAAASEACRATVLVKCEHQQRTGSFKLRGALSKVFTVTPEDKARGIVTASSGNHGLGVAQALELLGGKGVICVPENVSPAKRAALSRFNVELRTLGADAGRTELLGRQLADELGMTFVSPYNDLDVIAGQGTIGLELVEQLGGRPLDAVVVSVGGGGLMSGIAATVKTALPGTRMIGTSPENDAAMAASIRAGQIVEVEALPTISDGTAGSVEPGSVTFPLCAELVDEWILVSEEQIYDALRLTIDTEHQLIEGAAAVALAAGIEYGRAHPGQTVAVVSCGANISTSSLRKALGPPAKG
jgi:threonine dehydratase